MTAIDNVLGKAHTKHKVSLYVPFTDNQIIDGKKIVQPIPVIVRSRFVRMVKIAFASRFGGASVNQIQGSWIDSDTKGLVNEDIDEIYTLVGDLTEADLIFFRNIAIVTKSSFGQDSVLLTIDSKGWFI